ncbi:1-acyl-sn-glycerol-3-phosphate acyltransferase [Nocardia sp. ET3-3]|uniref:1-acyl-sn-glycerol-3-phosphate acyltransferase n=1 Tax=Nocardia terrae TaxID=2675851 RepID=A0A7K1V897_9NOCA|nr:1-acyl-sn-glycerol-3-phosphate acyltransferase [Nocardia terrae]
MVLPNWDAVYDYYRDHRPNRLLAWAAYALLGRRFVPRVGYAAGARDSLRTLIREDRRPLLIVMNHLSELDPYTVSAAAWRSELRPVIGRTRVLAKDELFTTSLRTKLDMMGGMPVFRGKDHGSDAVGASSNRLLDTCAERMARGDSIALFPEGTVNNSPDLSHLLPLNGGVGQIADRARRLGAKPAVVTLGLSYGPHANPSKEQVRSASFHFGPPIRNLPSEPAEITALVQRALQDAVDHAVEAW